jgi:ATP-dependent DNA helicase RecG
MNHRPRIFISSVQKELAPERRALADFIKGDPLVQRYFDVFLFEDLPATDRRADDVYLDEVDRCGVYVGLFGNDYGFENAQGLSPTEREFRRATQKHKPRLIFVKGADDRTRHPKMQALIRHACSQLVRRRFVGITDLTAQLYASLVQQLEEEGLLRTVPFDAARCPRATLADLSDEKLRWFLRRARTQRQYVLDEDMPIAKALAHLNLLENGVPNHAAVLLFAKEPQRFLLTSEVKCAHFHGTEIRKPIPSYQIYKGTVFDLVDQAVDFILAKVARSVGTRAENTRAPVTYELPKEVVAEAVVNAIAHRDYASNASVQVMLFADRLEIWNPGDLPSALTTQDLRIPHASIKMRHHMLPRAISGRLEHQFEAAFTEVLNAIRLHQVAACLEVLGHSLANGVVSVNPDACASAIWLSIELMPGCWC